MTINALLITDLTNRVAALQEENDTLREKFKTFEEYDCDELKAAYALVDSLRTQHTEAQRCTSQIFSALLNISLLTALKGEVAEYEDVVEEVRRMRDRLAEVEKDAARYRFIRNGGAYIEPAEYEADGVAVKDMYMATETGKYYADLRDFDMDLDAAMNKEQP